MDGCSYPTFVKNSGFALRKRLKDRSVSFYQRSSGSSGKRLFCLRDHSAPLFPWPSLSVAPAFLHFSHFVQQYPPPSRELGSHFLFLVLSQPFKISFLFTSFHFSLFTFHLSKGNYSNLATEFVVLPKCPVSMNHRSSKDIEGSSIGIRNSRFRRISAVPAFCCNALMH